MSEPAEFRVRGRWVSMLTARLCVHHVHLGDACEKCALEVTTTIVDVGPNLHLETELANARRTIVELHRERDGFEEQAAEYQVLANEQEQRAIKAEDKATALELAARALTAPAVIIPDPPPSAPEAAEDLSKSKPKVKAKKS